MDEKQYFAELEGHIKKILDSSAQYKLIVAGPGTGKSFFFRRAIEHYGGDKKDYLALTFINNLEDELRKNIGDLAEVYTFHGYCHYLLRKYADLRCGLANDFHYYPPLIELIKSDWKILNKNESPQFVKLMRNTSDSEELEFFLLRGNYYNATGYDDSVFRIYKSLQDGKGFKERYKLVIVDEYQDFNSLETSTLKEIIRSNSALIVGDDDQALYCRLRDSDPKCIRELFRDDETFENFELPFCLRCPNAVISVFDTIIETAKEKGLLGERIDKQFNFFPPVKGEDSEKYPKVKLVLSSIQKKSPLGANYFGRYILQEIAQISKEEIEESHENNFPAVLIIGPTYYLNTLLPLFDHEGLSYEIRKTTETVKINISDGFDYLKDDAKSNLGWRIVLEE